MNEEKLVSIIVPIYNVEKYLDRCISSILNQSYRNLEIILVDDGSTDGSREICDTYARKDNRVKVIHQENQGVATARNAGLDGCRGDFISFVDSDDYIHPDFIKYLYTKLIETDSDICMCNYITTDEWDYSNKIDWNKKVDVYNAHQLLDLFYSDMHCNIIMLWNKIVKRECISDIRFDDGYINEDEGTSFKFIYKARRIVFCEEVLYYYFSREKSITGAPYDTKRLDILKAFENRMRFYKEHGEQSFFNRECMFYLSEILTNYYKVHKLLENNREILQELKKKYDNTYKVADKSEWGFSRKLMYKVFKMFPLLYGIIKF